MPPRFIGHLIAAVAIVWAAYATTGPSAAITAEVARKCQALKQRAFPPREIGNPAAGSDKGTGAVQAAFFRKYGGEIDDPQK